jgi:hypothetical protein
MFGSLDSKNFLADIKSSQVQPLSISNQHQDISILQVWALPVKLTVLSIDLLD